MNVVQIKTIETNRLLIKIIDPTIMNEAFSQLSDLELLHLFALETEEALQTLKEKQRKGFTTHAISFRWFTLFHKDNNRPIGSCSYHTWHTAHSRAEIGYHTQESHKNKGYMKEALPAILHHGFQEMNLNRVEAFIGRNNEPSQKLVTRLGFVQEGILREHYCKNGIIEDSVCFSLLKREFNIPQAN